MAEPGLGTASPASGAELAASYREFRRGLLGFLRSRVGDPVVAEDLLQDVFLKALSALERGPQPADLGAWLHRIAANAVIDHYRTRRRTSALPADLAIAEDEGMPPEQQLAHCLRPFIEAMPPPYRETLLATAIEGRTLRSVSKELGLSESAIKSRVSRGRRQLRERLLDCCHVALSRSGQILDYAKRREDSGMN